MSYTCFENTLARLLIDEEFLESFLANPELALQDLDLLADEKIALFNIHKGDLSIAARSFRKKRSQECRHKNKKSIWQRLFALQNGL